MTPDTPPQAQEAPCAAKLPQEGRIYVAGMHLHADMFARHHRIDRDRLHVCHSRQLHTLHGLQNVTIYVLPGWIDTMDHEVKVELRYMEVHRGCTAIYLSELDAYGIPEPPVKPKPRRNPWLVCHSCGCSVGISGICSYCK